MSRKSLRRLFNSNVHDATVLDALSEGGLVAKPLEKHHGGRVPGCSFPLTILLH